MAKSSANPPMFLGRIFNVNTAMYEFRDGSGIAIPAEAVIQLELDGLYKQGGIGLIFLLKDRLANLKGKPLEESGR